MNSQGPFHEEPAEPTQDQLPDHAPVPMAYAVRFENIQVKYLNPALGPMPARDLPSALG